MPDDADLTGAADALGAYWNDLLGDDSGAPGDAPRPELDPALAETVRAIRAGDEVPAPPAGLADRVWQDLMGSVALVPHPVVAPGGLPTANGHLPAGAAPGRLDRRPSLAGDGALRRWAAASVRALAIGALAGLIAGVIGWGLGFRVVMRIAALAAGPERQGAITQNGNRVGDITLAGTLELLFTGAVLGVVFGIVYVAVRPWLPWTGLARGAVFGVALWATFGWVVMEGGNPDYHRFGPALLNVCTFSLLFAAFGLLVAPLADRLDRAVPIWPTLRPFGPRTLGTQVALGGGALIGLLFAGAGVVVVGPVVVLTASVRGLVSRATGRFDRPADLLGHPRAALAAYAVLAAPVLVGLTFTLRAIGEILAG